MGAVSDTPKLTTQAIIGSVHSGSAPVPRISPNQGTPVGRKPLVGLAPLPVVYYSLTDSQVKVTDPIDLTIFSDEDEPETVLPSSSAPSTHPPNPTVSRPQPRFIQPGTPSPPSATRLLPTPKVGSYLVFHAVI